jgi:hypothetical protein
MVFTVENNATFTIKGSNGFHASIKNGELTINAAKEISIKGKGGGDITFEQSGGGFKIDPAGNVKLYGNKVKLGGQGQVNLIGNVSYDIGSGSIPGAASVTPPLVVQLISGLVDEELEPSIQDIKIVVNDEFLNQYSEHLKLLDDIKYRLRSDLGDEREGVLIDGLIEEKQVEIKNTFTLEFDKFIETDVLK